MSDKNVVSTQIRFTADVYKHVENEEKQIARKEEIRNYFLSNGYLATAKRYSISRTRVYQIVNTIDKLKKEFDNKNFKWLTIRMNYVLRCGGIVSMEDLRNIYEKHGKKGIMRIQWIGEGIADYIIKHLTSEQEVS